MYLVKLNIIDLVSEYNDSYHNKRLETIKQLLPDWNNEIVLELEQLPQILKDKKENDVIIAPTKELGIEPYSQDYIVTIYPNQAKNPIEIDDSIDSGDLVRLEFIDEDNSPLKLVAIVVGKTVNTLTIDTNSPLSGLIISAKIKSIVEI